jgi:hypothetical protein
MNDGPLLCPSLSHSFVQKSSAQKSTVVNGQDPDVDNHTLECANIYVKFGAHGPIRELHCPPDIWLDNGVLFISFCRYFQGAKATILFLFSLLFYFFSNTCLPTYLPTYLSTYLPTYLPPPPPPPPLRCSYLHTYIAMFCTHWIEVGLKVLSCNDTCVCFVKQASSCSGI